MDLVLLIPGFLGPQKKLRIRDEKGRRGFLTSIMPTTALKSSETSLKIPFNLNLHVMIDNRYRVPILRNQLYTSFVLCRRQNRDICVHLFVYYRIMTYFIVS